LADVNESDRSYEVLISTEEQDTFRVISKHLNDANKQTWGGYNLTTLLSNLQDRGRKTTRRGHEGTPFYSIPSVVNRCLSKNDTFGPTTLRNSKFNNNNNVMVKMYNDRTTIRKEHQIVIIGDSHSRGYAAEVKNHLTTNF
jgi:hypothetical protein